MNNSSFHTFTATYEKQLQFATTESGSVYRHWQKNMKAANEAEKITVYGIYQVRTDKRKNIHWGAEHCAYCQKYNKYGSCDPKCPIVAMTGTESCGGTPWINVRNNAYDFFLFRTAITAMFNFIDQVVRWEWEQKEKKKKEEEKEETILRKPRWIVVCLTHKLTLSGRVFRDRAEKYAIKRKSDWQHKSCNIHIAHVDFLEIKALPQKVRCSAWGTCLSSTTCPRGTYHEEGCHQDNSPCAERRYCIKHEKDMRCIPNENDLWKTNQGEYIKVCDMEDDHLINTIRMLRQYALTKVIRQSSYTDWVDYVAPIFHFMTAEALKRGLDLPYVGATL